MIFDWEEYAKIAREAIAEGCVLLKNDGPVLPFAKGQKVAVFGRIQMHYYKSGTGSGGMVNAPYVVSILDALKEAEEIDIDREVLKAYEDWVEIHPFDKGVGWANEPRSQVEMPVEDSFVRAAADRNDVALVILGRSAGEDQDSHNEPGSYLLTEGEEQLLEKVCGAFERVAVVLNVGNVMDMKWVEKYNPGAVMYTWQGGMEGGNGVVDLLVGRKNPSGKMSDTIAYEIEDYPSTKYFGDEVENFYAEDIYVGYRYFETLAKDKVMYPFGYGLSYTTFSVERDVYMDGEDCIDCGVIVTNTGDRAGKEVVQLYVEKPQGKLGQPSRVLVDFAKTKELQPGESQMIMLSCYEEDMVSYDDSGCTGFPHCYVLEEGEYHFFVGTDVRNGQMVGTRYQDETVCVRKLEQALAPVKGFERMHCGYNEKGEVVCAMEPVPLRKYSLQERIKEEMPTCLPYTGDKGYQLKDVQNGKVSMEIFLAQLSDEDLICMSRGEGMCSPKVTPGTAAAFGGVTESLKKFGIPVGCCADGPSGIRMDCGTYAFSMPSGTLLACSFNTELTEELYVMEGKDLRRNKVDTLLGPGINIHRNPLNGRNFEYFSEDPLLTGRMAIAQLRGMGKEGVTGTVKHFACNNQENKRHKADSVVSERAAREIYLKPYRMAVEDGCCYSIMSTYGPVNGIWTGGNYDLLTTILRKEWGYDGLVMTDWWTTLNEEGGPDSRENTAPMIAAQNDIYMVVSDAASNSGGDNAAEALAEGRITRAQLVRNAANICRVLLQMPAMKRLVTGQEEVWETKGLKEGAVTPIVYERSIEYTDGTGFSLADMPTNKGDRVALNLSTKEKGFYRMVMQVRSASNKLAQMPVAIYNGMQYVETITVNGTEGAWTTIETVVVAEAVLSNRIIMQFGLGGIEFGEVTMVLKETSALN